ncbi:MAG TPA: M28 family peptidase [Gemmataceae bacterium]|nr:M28 family peptidase [Gemmataceae bacterium]
MSRLAIGLLFVIAAFLALGGLQWLKTGSGRAQPAPPEQPQRDAFAADRAPGETPAVAFDPQRAMGYLESICKIGPRISGTEGMRQQQELVKKHFEAHGAKVEFQRFTARQLSQKQPVEMANLIVSWHPERERRVILCSHYDTRPIADQEPDPRQWTQPFLSANDGGSGVALLMELANHLGELKTEVGVDVVLFDGEEYIFDPKRDKYFFGSEHFGQVYRQERPKHRYVAAVLLDMIAGKNARIPMEPFSVYNARALVDELWKVAAELRCTAFEKRPGQAVQDDHLALQRAGIPAVDLIDFSYPHWHRLSDVPENCSGESMQQVARVLTVWLGRVK